MPAPRILVVDDKENMRKSLSGLLQGHGYEVVTAGSGPGCLQIISAQHFDLVILDIIMPEMSGIEVLQKIKEVCKDTEIIVITAYADKEKAIATFRLGVYDFIEKPFEPKEMLNTISNCLNQLELKKEIEGKRQALKGSEEKYRTLTESSLTGIFIHQDGKYIFVNDRFAEIHGYAPEELRGKEYWTLIHPDERKTLRQVATKRLKGKLVPQRYEVRRLKKGGETVYCEMMATRSEYNGRPAIMGNIVDITERKQAEEALRESEARLTGILGAMTDHMSVIDKQYNIVWANDVAKRLFGPDLVGKKCHMAYHRRDKVCKSCVVEKTFADGKSHEHETEVIRADGEKMNFWCTTSVAAQYPDGRPKLVIEISRDITERKQAEEALRESERKLRFLSSHLLTAQERERRRISIELHDELGQALMVLKLKLRSIERNLRTDQTEIRQDCEDTLLYIDQVIKNVRLLSRDLSPSILDDLGLFAAIRWLIDDFAKHYNIKTSLDMEEINNLFSREAQIIIYRIFQESLTNIGKHAQATCVSVVIKKRGGNVFFIVKDDGKGFDVEQVQGSDFTERGLGLAAMDERARMLGGFFYIWSQEGKGTEITFAIPTDKGGSQ